MKQIYAEFNDFDDGRTAPLVCAGSVASIARLAEQLEPGELVMLSDGELRVKARVYLRVELNRHNAIMNLIRVAMGR